MDQKWMDANRLSTEYWNDVEEFIKFAVERANNSNRIKCSCIRCDCLENITVEVLRDHLSLMGLIKVIQDGYGMVRVQEIDRLIPMIENVMKEKESILVKMIN